AVSEGLDRDRAVDESGNQLGVFGRVGARPLTKDEQRRLYLRGGRLWQVSDDPGDATYGYPRPLAPPERWFTTKTQGAQRKTTETTTKKKELLSLPVFLVVYHCALCVFVVKTLVTCVSTPLHPRRPGAASSIWRCRRPL